MVISCRSDGRGGIIRGESCDASSCRRKFSAILTKASLTFSFESNVARNSLMIFSISAAVIDECTVAEGAADATLVVGVFGAVTGEATVDCWASES